MLQNEFEIKRQDKDKIMICYMNDFYFEKAENLCRYIVNTVKVKAYWYNNLDTNKIEIYTDKINFSSAKKAFSGFEEASDECLSKHRAIINHRHKKIKSMMHF